MCDVRKSVVRLGLAALAAGLLAGAMLPARAQVNAPGEHRRRETNASHRARIQRTIEDTYSHRYEVFGGGGYLRFKSGDDLKKNNEVSWAAAVNYYLSPKFAVVGDARGSFGNANALTNNVYGVYHPQINEYMFMGGGSYRLYTQEKVAVSAQATGGVGWGIFSGGSKGFPSTLLGVWPDETRPAFSVGVNADYNLYPNLAFRVTPTYVATTFGGGIQNNLGFNAGVLYRFGRR